MSQKQNLGYDSIKKMLNTMRNLNENTQSKNVLKEQEEEQAKVSNLVLNDNVEVKIHSADPGDLDLAEDKSINTKF